MNTRRWISVVLAIGWLSACAGDDRDDSPAGSRNSVAGADFARGVDADLAAEEEFFMLKTAQVALEFNRIWETSEWRNRETGSSGTVTPVRTYRNSGGQYCREYRATATIAGEKKTQLGNACRDSDGMWRLAP